MQRHVMSKHRNAGLTPFQTVPVFSQKCQRFRFKHDCRNDRVQKKRPGFDLYCNKLQRQFTLPPERNVWCYSQWQPAYTQILVAMPHIEFFKGIPTALEQDS